MACKFNNNDNNVLSGVYELLYYEFISSGLNAARESAWSERTHFIFKIPRAIGLWL